MGHYESELERISSPQAPDWRVPARDELERALPGLIETFNYLAGPKATGLDGSTGDQAQEGFDHLRKLLIHLHEDLVDKRHSINQANIYRKQANDGLSSATVDAGTHAAILAAGGVMIPGAGLFVAEAGIQLYQNFLRGQREDEARTRLETLTAQLAAQPLDIDLIKLPDSAFEETTIVEPTYVPPKPRAPYSPGDSGGGDYNGPGGSVDPGSTSGGPGTGGPGTGGPGSGWPGSGGPGSGPGWHPSTPSVDGGLEGGYVPGRDGSGGSGGGLPFRPGGGMGGLVGGGAGAAALAVGARIGGSGMSGTGGGLGGFGSAGGAAANPAAGGLLGGARGGVGAAGEVAGGSGAAGGRPAGGMMGGGGGAGGSEKEKRSGLGGPIAPKLEDDEERGPRSAGAMAGGRDTAVSVEEQS